MYDVHGCHQMPGCQKPKCFHMEFLLLLLELLSVLGGHRKAYI